MQLYSFHVGGLATRQNLGLRKKRSNSYEVKTVVSIFILTNAGKTNTAYLKKYNSKIGSNLSPIGRRNVCAASFGAYASAFAAMPGGGRGHACVRRSAPIAPPFIFARVDQVVVREFPGAFGGGFTNFRLPTAIASCRVRGVAHQGAR